MTLTDLETCALAIGYVLCPVAALAAFVGFVILLVDMIENPKHRKQRPPASGLNDANNRPKGAERFSHAEPHQECRHRGG